MGQRIWCFCSPTKDSYREIKTCFCHRRSQLVWDQPDWYLIFFCIPWFWTAGARNAYFLVVKNHRNGRSRTRRKKEFIGQISFWWTKKWDRPVSRDASTFFRWNGLKMALSCIITFYFHERFCSEVKHRAWWKKLVNIPRKVFSPLKKGLFVWILNARVENSKMGTRGREKI